MVSKRKYFLYGLLVGVASLGACANGIMYKYYGLELPDYDGTLLGPTEKQDVPFKKCEPDPPDPDHPEAQVKGKCVVLFEDEWFKAKQELIDLRHKVKNCK